MQYHAIHCNTMQYHAIPCKTMQYHAIPCNIMQYNAISCNFMQYHAILCIIINCWRSVPLPCGQYKAIFYLVLFGSDFLKYVFLLLKICYHCKYYCFLMWLNKTNNHINILDSTRVNTETAPLEFKPSTPSYEKMLVLAILGTPHKSLTLKSFLTIGGVRWQS